MGRHPALVPRRAAGTEAHVRNVDPRRWHGIQLSVFEIWQIEAIRQELDAGADKANKRPFIGPFTGT
jgi:hypothetical protein